MLSNGTNSNSEHTLVIDRQLLAQEDQIRSLQEEIVSLNHLNEMHQAMAQLNRSNLFPHIYPGELVNYAELLEDQQRALNEENERVWESANMLARAFAVVREEEEFASREVERMKKIVDEQARAALSQKAENDLLVKNNKIIKE